MTHKCYNSVDLLAALLKHGKHSPISSNNESLTKGFPIYYNIISDVSSLGLFAHPNDAW